MNLDYLFLFHLHDASSPEPPFFYPDGLGMSVLLTSPGPAVCRAGRLASTASLVAPPGAVVAGPHPDAPLLRRRLAAVRLPLLPRLRPVRHRPVRLGGGHARPDRGRLADPDRRRRGRDGRGVLWAYGL